MRFEFDGSEGRVSVRVWEHPGARRLVVIAHGYGEHIERYDHVARALRARGAAVYGPDHLGHGRSAGERVVIDGQLRLSPGAKVDVKKAS